MRKKGFKVLLLVTLLAIATSSMCFAGTWVTEQINTPEKVLEHVTNTHLNTRGMPSIGIWVSAEPSVRKVQIDLLVWDYVSKPISEGGGWQYVISLT